MCQTLQIDEYPLLKTSLIWGERIFVALWDIPAWRFLLLVAWGRAVPLYWSPRWQDFKDADKYTPPPPFQTPLAMPNPLAKALSFSFFVSNSYASYVMYKKNTMLWFYGCFYFPTNFLISPTKQKDMRLSKRTGKKLKNDR